MRNTPLFLFFSPHTSLLLVVVVRLTKAIFSPKTYSVFSNNQISMMAPLTIISRLSLKDVELQFSSFSIHLQCLLQYGCLGILDSRDLKLNVIELTWYS